MARRYYFLLSALPRLPELGEAPAMPLQVFHALVAQEASALGLVEAVLLEQDLLWREAALAGEVERPEPVVLSAEQVAGEAPLPEFLTGGPDRPRRIAADATWEAYYRYAHGLARRKGCPFVKRWAGFEVALRNALAAVRAKALDLDAEEYLLAREIADEEAPVGEIVSAWSEAPDPLSALRTLDEHRWTWIERESRYFTFALDELTAYARKLVLLTRWHALARQEAQAAEGT